MRPSPAVPPQGELPDELKRFITDLETWAKANAADAQTDTIKFWVLKIPAVLSSASAGVLTLFHFETVSAILAGVASLCVIIDAVNPGGQLRNAHLRAVHDLRNLEQEIVEKWGIARLKGQNSGKTAAEILEDASKRREKIAAALKQAETSFDKKADPTS